MPVIARPSKLFQRTICCSAKPAVSTPGGAYGRVHCLRAAVGGHQRADLARPCAAVEREREAGSRGWKCAAP